MVMEKASKYVNLKKNSLFPKYAALLLEFVSLSF